MKQYIDFYKEQQATLKSHSVEVLNEPRDEAFSVFSKLGFGGSNTDYYHFSDLSQVYGADFGLNLRRLPAAIDLKREFKCSVPGITNHVFYVVNDQFYPMKTDDLPQGVIACSLHDAAKRFPDLVRKYYGSQSQPKDDGVVAFNMAFAQDGFFLYVPDDVVVEKPIQLVNLMYGKVDLMANSHNLVVLGKRAQVKMVVCDHSIGDVRFLSNRVTEVFVGERAVYDHYKVESTHPKMTNVSSLFVSQQAKSDVLTNIITLHNGFTRNNVQVTLTGPQAKTTLAGMAIENGVQHVDNATFVHHAVADCTSNELFKYILDDASSGAFFGRILVAQDAQKTTAYQINRNICLTREARMRTKPQLEIYADDVKCSHGATVGQLDEAALFYMRSRGIAEKEARLLLMSAFVNDVVENVRVDSLKDRIRMLVEKRLRGEATQCNGCRICG